MKRLYVPLILFLFLILEGVAIKFLPSRFVLGEQLMVPHWVLVLLIYVAVFYDRGNKSQAVIYAIIFGLLVDIVYTGILGVYMFSYAFVIYIIQNLKKLLHGNFFVMLLFSILGLVLSDMFITFIYDLVDIIVLNWDNYWLERLLPTVLLNLVFFVALYPILAKRLMEWGSENNWD
ncbi:rod shape-determining protein MreD [Oceanobacillus halophilus]|uniref:Rod shape-determining protein MreD n=1 Tax=Oceanobacillus halophilus TaxID=930130 RepID=A0A495ADH1_9BACI|nr:rod shape-determining protein MreD [Oceanobacillus halophilus]RKQ37912.1 rod shape-determining protein MreD [Oceanobacillus halophilus]